VSSKSTGQVYGSALFAFAFLLGLAADSGGYAAPSWGWSTVVPAGVAAGLLAFSRARAPTRAGAVFLALLAAFVAWIWFSALWSDDLSETVLDGERGLVYLASAVALLLLGRSLPLLYGALGAITAVSAYALATRIFGGATYDVASAAPDATRRLAEPLGYSNALAAFAAIGVVLALGLAATTRRLALAAPVLVLVPTLYFTYGRGAWLALGVGLAVAALPRARRRLVAVLACALVILVSVAAVAYGGRVYRAFSTAGPTVKANQRERLLSVSGSSRVEYWRVAWRDYRSNALLGSGSGTFQRYWLAHREDPLPVRDAHALELETLTELGPVGLVLLVSLLAVPIAAGVRARDHPGAPAALGGYAVFLVHSAQDWDWELPAVTVAALVCAAALLALDAGGEPRVRPGRLPRLLGIAGCCLIASIGVLGFVGNHFIERAGDALDRAQAIEAEKAARSAKTWAPWSPEPWRLLGEAQLEQGKVDEARSGFQHGLAKDARDWELWVDLALVSEGAARRAALARAAALNPLDPELRRLRATM
jgi:O-antigen ligase